MIAGCYDLPSVPKSGLNYPLDGVKKCPMALEKQSCYSWRAGSAETNEQQFKQSK
jgi:hypothetical protein